MEVVMDDEPGRRSRRSRTAKGWTRSAATLAGLVLVTGGCGSGDEGSSGSSDDTGQPTSSETVALNSRGLTAVVLEHLPPDVVQRVWWETEEQGDQQTLVTYVVVRTRGGRGMVAVSLMPPGHPEAGYVDEPVKAGPAFSDDNTARGSTLIGGARRDDESVVSLFAEFYGPPVFSVEVGQAIVDDPAVDTETSPATDQAGERLGGSPEEGTWRP
jgi:hypothetical protein